MTSVNRFIAIKPGRSSRRRRARRDGYVLLMTLALLVIAALSQTGLARRSLLAALEANQARADLQRRWAATSCRQLLLEQAEEILIGLEDAQHSRRPKWPAPKESRAQFTLGGFAIELVLADEDAKANLNALYARKPGQVRLMLMELVRSSLVPELRPDTSPEAKLRRRWFSSWGQVFNIASVLSTPGGWQRLSEIAAEVTCWGQGKPNIRRASDRIVETAAATVVSRDVARKLLEARRRTEGDLLLADLLAGLDLKRIDQVKLRGVLGDRSSCHSLRMALGDGRRQWYYLWIAGDRAASSPAGVQSFSW